jgi:hypothetical protein
MSAETLSLIAGTILSLLFSYVPGAKDWYAQFEPAVKRLIMLVLILASSGGVFALACLGWGPAFGVDVSCDQPGLFGLIQQIMVAIIANQSTFAISPHTSGCSPSRVRG